MIPSSQSLFGPALRGVLSAFGGDVAVKILGVSAAFIILSRLDPYQYGLWQLLLSVPIAFGVVTFPGIASMLVADVSREIGSGNVRRANGILIRSAVLFVSLSFLGGSAMAIAAPFIHLVSGIQITVLLMLLSISVAAIGIRQVYQLVLQSNLEFVHVQVVKTLYTISYLVGIAFFLLILGRGFEGVVYAYVAASLVPILLYAPYVGRKLIASFRNQEAGEWRPFIEAVWHRGRWALLTDGVNAIVGSLWPWVVGYFLGVETVGILGVALMLLAQASAFVPISSMLRSVLPRTVESTERMREWLMRSMKFSALGYSFAGLCAFFACTIIFPIWFPQYVPALPIFAVLLLTLPLRGITSTAGEWFYATKRQRELFFVSALFKLVMFALLPLFLYVGGLLGYVLWYLLHSDLLLFARMRVIAHHLGTTFKLSLLVPDRVDDEILRRVLGLVRTKTKEFLP